MAEPTTITVVPLQDGGLVATVHVPTFSGGQDFTITAERDEGGDWRVNIPWRRRDDDETDIELDNGVACTNGWCYLGAPDDQ